MEVHKILGNGLLEIVYKDALEYEFNRNNIPFEREKEYRVIYKNQVMKHRFNADFVVFDKIILEIKASSKLINEYIAQTLNYPNISGCRLGLLVNFGQPSLQYKRIVK